MPRKTYFSDLWLKISQYKDCLRKKDDVSGQCSYCAKDIDVFNMGESALKSHAGSNLDPLQNQTILCHFLIEVKMRRIKR